MAARRARSGQGRTTMLRGFGLVNMMAPDGGLPQGPAPTTAGAADSPNASAGDESAAVVSAESAEETTTTAEVVVSSAIGDEHDEGAETGEDDEHDNEDTEPL